MGPRVGLDVFQKKELSCLYGIRTLDRPTRSLVTIPTTLTEIIATKQLVSFRSTVVPGKITPEI